MAEPSEELRRNRGPSGEFILATTGSPVSLSHLGRLLYKLRDAGGHGLDLMYLRCLCDCDSNADSNTQFVTLGT